MQTIMRSSTGAASVAALALALIPVTAAPASAAAGDVLTFGANPYGQLGNEPVGSTRHTPEWVLGGASDVAGGREHTLALKSGRVYAWGADLKGAVGDGGTYQSAVNSPQLLTSAVSGVDSVTTGHYHSMALDRDTDTVWAWGWNSRGQIGPSGGTQLKVGTPVKVGSLSGQVSMIAAGRAHSLALVGGRVYAWGDNGSGQLGKAANTGRNPTPTLVQGLPAGVDWIAGGRDSSFAIADGVLYAWGNNAYGQLGDGSTIQRTTPVRISGVFNQVESGADHTVALLANGTVKSWGRNRYGQLGVSGPSNRLTPTTVTGLSGITQVRVGRDHSMAIGGGKFYAWGRNDGGQLGVSPSTTPQSTPKAVPGAAGARDAGGGQVFTVAML